MKKLLSSVVLFHLLAGCAAPTAAPDEETVEVQSEELTAAQQALATLARAEVAAAAEKFQGEPNLLVEIDPTSASRLRELPIGGAGNAALRTSLTNVGTTTVGAARIAGFSDSVRFRGIPSKTIFYLRKVGDGASAVGIVIHTIDRIDECSFAKVSAFDLKGTRVLSERIAYCS
jgi:hypothetical protein